MATMPLKELSLQTLSEIDGARVQLAFDAALKRITADCDDRPALKAPRTVTLQIAVIPIADHTGIADDCKVQCQITDAIPKRKSKVWDMALRKGGKLLFRPDSLDEVDQTTMFDGE